LGNGPRRCLRSGAGRWLGTGRGRALWEDDDGGRGRRLPPGVGSEEVAEEEPVRHPIEEEVIARLHFAVAGEAIEFAVIEGADLDSAARDEDFHGSDC
ncbi:MAG: hypothetical protein M3Z22_00265, partial [Verrucomicrobiota bacterium]|nr:hypothetical protein [Verrucomicrobiota bacterium]